MEIEFSSRKLQKICNSAGEMWRKVGDRMARVLKRRLAELHAADTLEDMGRLPGARCHELGGDRKGECSVDLVHPYRLIFVPDHDPVPTKSDGGLDRERVTRIRVTEVVDTH